MFSVVGYVVFYILVTNHLVVGSVKWEDLAIGAALAEMVQHY